MMIWIKHTHTEAWKLSRKTDVDDADRGDA